MELNQVTLACTDYEASVDFYRRLGLTLIVDSPPDYARFETPSGETLSVHRVDRLGRSETTVYFEVDDVDATVRQLAAAGIGCDEPPVDQTWLWREARLTDPDGNRLCIYRAGSNRRFPPWRIDDE